jgi:hypothetical protein
MGKSTSLSLGGLVLNIAVAAYLFATGIIALFGGRKVFGISVERDEIRNAVLAVFKNGGTIADILTIVLAILAVAAGIFILLKFFGIKISSLELILIILTIAWLVVVIFIDIIDPIRKGPDSKYFLPWLRDFGCHLMALGGLLVAAQK